jgi:acetyl-CoA synthetase
MATTSASCRPISPPTPAKYFTGDGCRRDSEGYYWITGRVDDVINVSGHRMGTAEVESALVAHPKVSEAAVVGYPHDIKGQGIYAYVTLMEGDQPSDALRKELVTWVRKGDRADRLARPDPVRAGLPKTRSGKIMRRILRKIAEDEFGRSATPRRWPIRPSSTISWRTARTGFGRG